MIPTDHWHDNGDGTAWWVPAAIAGAPVVRELDRPCDTCDGIGRRLLGNDSTPRVCPDCDGTGRHTFTVELTGCAHSMVDPCVPPCGEVGRVWLRVSVVPGMVLEIKQWDGNPTTGLYVSEECNWPALWRDGVYHGGVTPPSAAKPGMWLVKVKVHS